MKKILLINGHPLKNGTNATLLEHYLKGLHERSDVEIRTVWVTDLPMEKFLRVNYYEKKDTDPVIQEQQENILWADHIVMFHPVWWGSLPSLFKAYIENVFTSGFAFKYNNGRPTGLLSGKTSHIITTCDTPPWIYRYFFLSPSVNELKNRTLEFCAIKVTKVFVFGSVISSSDETKNTWFKKVYTLGKNLSQ